MSEDAPVNTGAVAWPDDFTASVMVRRMQTKLHLWAARDAGRRFDDLFNLVYDPAFLVVAWERVSTNKGAGTPGIDKVTAAGVEARDGVLGLLGHIRKELKSGSFRPVEVRRVLIPKSNGKLRKLGIPTLADRVVQASLKLVLEPIFEADFKPCSYGFRPNRRVQDAIAEIHSLASGASNYHWVLEADIKACFDEISHTALMDRLRVRVKDKRVCALVKAFLKAGVLTELGDREETYAGTPQGGILSPLLANIALSALDDHFDQTWRQQMSTAYQRRKRRRNGKANFKIVRYADDFVIMVSGDRHHAEELREEVAAVLAPLGLRLSPEKTAVVHIDEGFDFLGFPHPPPAETRDSEVVRLHQAVQEGHPVHQGQGIGEDVQVDPPSGSGRAPAEPEHVAGGVGEPLPARSVQGHLQRGRPPCVEPADALDQGQVRGQVRAEHETDAASLLRRRMEVRLQRGRVHRRLQRQGDPLPLSRWQHPDPVDPGTAGHTAGARVRHGERPVRRESHAGCGGGPRETDGGNTGTAPAARPDPGLVPGRESALT